MPMLLVLAVLIFVVKSDDTSCSRVATFNTALARSVGDYENRTLLTADAIKANNADMYCLQEYWLESDINNLLQTVSDKYPYHYSAIHYRQGALRKPTNEMGWLEYLKTSASRSSPCSFTDIKNIATHLLPCAYKGGCMGKFNESGEAAAQCLAQNCKSLIKSDKIQPECYSCILLMSAGFGEVASACAPDFIDRRNRWNSPGLVLLSKSEMSNLKYVDFSPGRDSVVERGYLEADIKNVSKVICTHLTTVSKYNFEYDVDFANYTEQQKNEIDQLITRFGETDHLVMGDLNIGPTVKDNEDSEKNLAGDVQENYNIFKSAGYKDPYLEQDGRCTYCKNNPLVKYYDNNDYDHILVLGDAMKVSQAKRILDGTVPRVISDHFGVEATVCPV